MPLELCENENVPKATVAVAWAMIDVNVIDGAPNIDKPEKNPMNSITSRPIAAPRPGVRMDIGV